MSLKDTCLSVWESLPVTFSSGSSLTAALNLGGLRLFGIVLPSAWTTANLTFQVSPDGGENWVDLRAQDGEEIIGVASTSSCLMMDPVPFASIQYLRIRSGTKSTPVEQAAERKLQLVLRPV